MRDEGRKPQEGRAMVKAAAILTLTLSLAAGILLAAVGA
jgi:hypothetical protein